MCKAPSLYQTRYSVSLAIILFLRWNPFLNHTHLPPHTARCWRFYSTLTSYWCLSVAPHYPESQVKVRRDGSQSPPSIHCTKACALCCCTNLLSRKTWIDSGSTSYSYEALASQLPLKVSLHIDKMGITKLCSRTNILLILPYQFTAYVRSFVGAPCPAGSEIFWLSSCISFLLLRNKLLQTQSLNTCL